MWALYRKELRTLWPFLILNFLLMSGDLLYRPFTERLDEQTWESIASYLQPGEASGFAWILIALAVSIAFSAFPREHDEKTIQLLYALPVRPGFIFAAKVAAGLTMLWVGVLMLLCTDAVLSTWDTQSFTGSHWRADLALTHVALQMTFCFIAYAHGLLASVLRLFGLLPYVLLLVVASILEGIYPPAAWIDPRELLTARYEGTELVVSWTPWIAHVAVATVALATAYLAWMGPADSIGTGLAKARASVFGKLAAGCGTAFIGVLLLVLALLVREVDLGDEIGAEPSEDIETPGFETAMRETERYRFTYPVSHEARALTLIEGADALHAAVQARLGAERGPRLLADLTEVSGEHLGIASWTHLRVGLAGERDLVRLRHTFTHETVHAFQHRLSDRRQASHFFAEGSAEHIAYLVAPNAPAHRQARVVAAASWERLRVRGEDLRDEDRLRARFDPTLVYSLGERWTAALVSVCGDRAVGDALRAMGREGAPRDLGPRAFWEDTLRASECDIEAVDAAFSTLMVDEVRALSEEISRLPRLGGGVVGRDGAAVLIVALLDRDPDPAWTFLVRIRADADSEDTEVVGVRGRVDPDDPRRVVFRVSRALIPARRFQLLLSVMSDPRGWPFSEPWQWASVP